ncbi:uracil-DNA glycosylase [Indivirus ILV1]|uniref:Uracil-DNA glycosylase n=1 Tax=Indivirus ILV1 TaxID=1977633 RepID=A0A1V0SCU3_9VIRU|nr:uracil-DNA glycosylase [Indivirus ILV1]
MNSHNISVSDYSYQSWVEKFPDYNVDLNIFPINDTYKEFYNGELFKNNIDKLNKYLSYCLNFSNGTVNIFPYPDLVFNALNATPLDKIKIVILGQDPYHDSRDINNHIIPQAMGLSFSVPEGMPIPSSLQNIYKNLLKFKHITKIPKHGNLSFWAYQGCLMLNTILTVQKGCPDGHKKKWIELTDSLIKFISDNTKNIVFMLWGKNAYEKHNLIDDEKHKIIISSHPSGLSCATKFKSYECFNNEDHFGKANKYLKKHHKNEILFEII